MADKPLSWNEIRDRAITFSAEWRGETSERAEAQTFWNEFFEVFGIRRRRVAQFEVHATRASTGGRGRIDAFWPGQVAVEHKSAGKSLEEAETQALDYLDSIGGVAQPRMIITSDFAHFRLRDLDATTDPVTEFPLEDLSAHLQRFAFIAGYETRTVHAEAAVNVRAAEMMGAFYDALAATGYRGHDLRVFLVRCMFIFFADDTGVWEKGLFSDFLETRTAEDGSDTGALVERLFRVLDTHEERRSTALEATLARFPYVNGRLFTERIEIPDFTRDLRERLITCSSFDWSAISPAIFGSMFQSVMDKGARRALGAHYTSETNILKVIGPLFMDQFRADFEASRNSRQRLQALHQRLAKSTFFDPAAGCGNFLVIAYREIRALEFDILVRLDELSADAGQQHLSIDQVSGLSRVDVDQFFAIEIEEFPARIAETALYLVDHLANMRLSSHFGQYFARIPLRAQATVVYDNALRVEWADVLPRERCTFLFGNPPFIGGLRLDPRQSDDRARVFDSAAGVEGLRTGRLDYVACWYAKAFDYMAGTACKGAFVSTNSLVQGEQARSMGPFLKRRGFEIDFAHRTFAWTSEARGAAAVHVVIVGFSHGAHARRPRLYEYPTLKALPTVKDAAHINVWLTDAPHVEVAKRRTPFVDGLPPMTVGSQPTDGGHLLVGPDEIAAVRADATAAKYLKRYFGAEEMLDGSQRWCLWLADAYPQDLRTSAVLRERVAAVTAARSTSPTEAFRRTPGHLFTHRKHPGTAYIALPQNSTDSRRLIPGAIYPADDVASNKVAIVLGSQTWLLGLLQSAAYMTWVRTVGGRLKSDPTVTADLAYNAYPWPALDDRAKERVAVATQEVLDARADHPTLTLADLYDPLAMPDRLRRAHDSLDRVVDGLYGFRKRPTEAERSARLFERFENLAAEAAASTTTSGAQRRVRAKT